MFIPAILIVIGILIILENAGIVTGDFWGYVWGAAILLVGLSFLMPKKKGLGSWCCWGGKSENK